MENVGEYRGQRSPAYPIDSGRPQSFLLRQCSGLASAKKHEFSHGQKPLPLLWADAKLEGLDSGVQLAAAKRTLSVLRGENSSALPSDGAVGRFLQSVVRKILGNILECRSDAGVPGAFDSRFPD